MPGFDVHQHVWGTEFVAALRARDTPPYLTDWTLHVAGEPPYELSPADHDAERRGALARADGLDRVLVSLSSPLGVEGLPPAQARPLLDAYHADALALPEPFGAWASSCLSEIDAARTARDLDAGFAGLQLPATALADASGFERCAPLLALLEDRDLPLFVHPGGSRVAGDTEPGWWPAMVPYVQQMHAVWYAFRAFGRPRHPRLRVCFALLAGLGPLHGERYAARAGGPAEVDPGAFVETSSYGPRAVRAVIEALGGDMVVLGSDRPYAAPYDGPPEPAGRHALRVTNPRRLLSGTSAVRGE
jgi:predicted TIM-barrel fold metal-dependent hydrolase